jgi:hypothetical protein
VPDVPHSVRRRFLPNVRGDYSHHA